MLLIVVLLSLYFVFQLYLKRLYDKNIVDSLDNIKRNLDTALVLESKISANQNSRIKKKVDVDLSKYLLISEQKYIIQQKTLFDPETRKIFSVFYTYLESEKTSNEPYIVDSQENPFFNLQKLDSFSNFDSSNLSTN